MKKLYYLLVVIVATSFIASCNFELTTANVDDIKICDNLSGSLCDSDNAILSTAVDAISVSCKLKNAPENTMVTFTWKYIENDPLVIDEVIVNSGNKGTNLDLNSTLSRPYNGWPKGKYEVVISIGENDSSPETKKFEIQ